MGMKTANYEMFNDTVSSETKTSDARDIAQIMGFAVRVSWDAASTGTVKLQAAVKENPQSSDWEDLSGFSQSLGGAAGSVLWNVVDSMYKCVRLHVQETGGAASTVVADMHTKGV